MKYELIMLRCANRMKYCDKSLSDEIKRVALTSYDVFGYRNGTVGQIKFMSERTELRDKYRLFWQSLVDGLAIIPKPYRVLLVCVYLKHADIQAICVKYKTSKSTLYRRLCLARKYLRNALESLGCDEQWYQDNFSELDL